MAVVGAAKRYGQAAFDVAKEHGTLEQWDEDLSLIDEVLRDPATMEFLVSPVVNRSAKQKALADILPNEEQALVRNLLLLLLERRRFHQVHDVIATFKELLLAERGIAVAVVTTAIKLSDSEQTLVRNRLAEMLNKEIEILPRVDPDIIGGVIAQVGDDLIDGSVRTQLIGLRRRMVYQA
jgi:F-type H+-transporting ATPase subunit delta